MQDMTKYKDLFLKTAKEHVLLMQTHVRKLQDGYDSRFIEEVHRAAHSLKGEALMMGYPQLGDLSFHLEKIAQKYNDEKSNIPEDILNTYSEGVVAMQHALSSIEMTNTEGDLSAIVALTKQIRQKIGML